jgi:hypothetical protein
MTDHQALGDMLVGGWRRRSRRGRFDGARASDGRRAPDVFRFSLSSVGCHVISSSLSVRCVIGTAPVSGPRRRHPPDVSALFGSAMVDIVFPFGRCPPERLWIKPTCPCGVTVTDSALHHQTGHRGDALDHDLPRGSSDAAPVTGATWSPGLAIWRGRPLAQHIYG